MVTETTETDVAAEKSEGEGESQVETIAVPKKDYDTMNQTLGSLKKELKDLKKAQEASKETPTQQTKTEDSALLQRLEKMSLRQAGISHPDDIELAQKTAKKWGVDIDEVLSDEDFKVKLERQQTSRQNATATSDLKGGVGTQSAKNTPEYWLAKGTPPTPADIPDRKIRQKIARAILSAGSSSGKTFYNE